jgi:hypothetical protein
MRSVWQGLSMPAQFFVRAMHFKNVKGDQIANDTDIPYESILAYIDESMSAFCDTKQAEVRSYMQQKYSGPTGAIQRDRHYFNFLKYIGKTVEQVVSLLQQFNTQQEMEDYCKRQLAIIASSQSQSIQQSKSKLQSQSKSESQSTYQLHMPNRTSITTTSLFSTPESESQMHIQPPALSQARPDCQQLNREDSESESVRLPPHVVTSIRRSSSHESQKRDIQISSIHDQLRGIREIQLEHSRLLARICSLLDTSLAHHHNIVDDSGLFSKTSD